MNPIIDIIQFPLLHIIANVMIAAASAYIVYAKYVLFKSSQFKALYKRFVLAWLTIAIIHTYDSISFWLNISIADVYFKVVAAVVIVGAALSFRSNLTALKKQPTHAQQDTANTKIRQQEDEIYALKQRLIKQQLDTEDLYRTRLKKQGISEKLLNDLQDAHCAIRSTWDDTN